MTIRRAVETDFEDVDRLLEQLMPGDRDRRRRIWAHLLNDPCCAAWVAVDDGAAVGFLDALLWDDIGHGHTLGLVNNLVVDARVRGQGIGQALLGAAIAHCEEHGAAELHVWTEADNEAAIRLYRKLRFADRGVLLERQI